MVSDGLPAYDTVRGAFPEGEAIYDTCEIRDRTHIQIAVRNERCIIGYFLPQPMEEHNPYLAELINKGLISKTLEPKMIPR
jgi:hypothetical protein